MLSHALRATLVAALLVLPVASAGANTSHAGWPSIDGMLLMNKVDGDRPLDGRPGNDPFGGTDSAYQCDEVHLDQSCLEDYAECQGRRDRHGRCSQWLTRTDVVRHNELLGGHGDDTIHAGPAGDVLWGDYKPSGQPANQHDVLTGGAGRDFIYASHGRNDIDAGGGDDWIKAHFGRGSIDCGGGRDLLYISRKAQRRYRIRHCERISHRTLGY